MDFSCIKAFLDEENTITIVSDKKTSFYINGAFLPVSLISQNKFYTYKANYFIDLNQDYEIYNEYNEKCKLQIRHFVKSPKFDELYYYDNDDLGSNYSKEKTTFKLWAPLASQVKLCYTINNSTNELIMTKGNKGVFEATIYGDLDGCLYTYKVTNNNVEEEVIDPYSYSCNSNGKQSAVINLNKLNFNNYVLDELKDNNKAIIYEVSVRDFSSDESIFKNDRSKYKAFLKHNLKSKNNNPIGFDYIKELGVTHVQLMPIFDFVTVDENNPFSSYNWGYDPYCYNCLEGSYSSNPNDPYSRLIEAKEMIDNFHKNNIKVTLDVVFNHTYYFIESIYNKIVPNYFYLMDNNLNLSNGSFCGNDIDSLKKMVHKYIVDMCIRYTKILQIDGLRFDLMGILDKDLILEIYAKCKQINPNFIIYGEGWNMPSMLPEDKRASLNNAKDLPKIGFFNDFFRDVVSGKANKHEKRCGYLSTNSSILVLFLNAMRGSIEKGCYFDNIASTINYVECHDNYTLSDKLKLTNPECNEEQRNRIQLCCIAATLFAQGTPFLHMGVEFNRSKFMVENSYNSSDEINMVRWENIDKYSKNIKAVKDFIDIRKKFECFNLTHKRDILNFIDGQIINDECIMITYAYKGDIKLLIFNPTNKKQKFELENEYKIIANHDGYVSDDKFYTQFKMIPFSFILLTR